MRLALPALVIALLAAPALAQDGAPTYASDIAPIIYKNCATCHRPGEGAPFSLLSYEDVARRGQMVAHTVDTGTMPPWHVKGGHEQWQGARSLTKAERRAIIRWVDAGMPKGDLSKAPEPPVSKSGWKLGEPDLILKMDEAFTVPADGPDIYRNFVLPFAASEDRWITAIDVHSDAPEVVHHVLYFGAHQRIREQAGSDGQPGFSAMGFNRNASLGGWAVGGQPQHLPMGLARRLPRDSDLVLSTHFHPSGRAHEAKLWVGVYFAKDKPEKTLLDFQVPPLFGRFSDIDVPAGEAKWVLEDSATIPVDIDLLSVAGHAHYICKSMKAWAVLPDGTEKVVFEVPEWDFNWQERYIYAEPVRIPKGSELKVRIVYDNSADNPNNPFSPPQRITWGQESTDEMGSIIFNGVAAQESEVSAFKSGMRQQFLESRGGARLKQLMVLLQGLDADGDGIVTAEELPRRFSQALERLDHNNDGVLDQIEIESLGQDSGPPRKKAAPKPSAPKPAAPKPAAPKEAPKGPKRFY